MANFAKIKALCYNKIMKNLNKAKVIFSFLGAVCLVFLSATAARGLSEDQINDEIRQLNGEIKNNREAIDDLEKRKKQYADTIKQKREEANTLANELLIIENRVAKAEIEIEDTKAQINEVNLEMKKIAIEIESKTEGIEKEKKNISNILKLIYRQSDASALEILLLNDSLADFLNRVKYLEDINKEMGDSLDNLKQFKADLERDKADLEVKNENLSRLKEELERNKLALEDEKLNKGFILEETKNSENQYQNLLSQARKEQENAAAEIASLEREVRRKMESLDKQKLQLNENGLAWPVSGRYITSSFHDPEYPFRYLFEHPAIDIRSPQSSQVRAAASGYVARVSLKGTAYGYIMIIHGDGLSTVYGHVSKAMVSEDEYVVQGQAIALSGGLPGTPGAGRLTSGPHLHFEVRKDGVPVNPEEYLP